MLTVRDHFDIESISDGDTNELPSALAQAVGVVREWPTDDILCYRFQDGNRATIDWFARDLRRVLRQWPAERPLRLLLDLREDNLIVGLYALRRAREISQLRPDVSGQTAVIATHPLTARIVGTAIRMLPNAYRQRIVLCCETTAIDWLQRRGTMVPVSTR